MYVLFKVKLCPYTENQYQYKNHIYDNIKWLKVKLGYQSSKESLFYFNIMKVLQIERHCIRNILQLVAVRHNMQ